MSDRRRRVRLDLAYDGAPFHGFARQPDLPTVQGELESALSRVCDQRVRLTCAGRTDAGVHANGQVVHADVDVSVAAAGRAVADMDDLRDRIDKMVGPAITVWSARTTPSDFHARFSATERRYRYRLVDAPAMHPLDRHAAWHVPGPLDVGAMRVGADGLLGEHDFAAFCKQSDDGHTVRRIDEITVTRPRSDGSARDEVSVRLRAPAFCRHQVRSIVGCLVAVGRGDHPPDWIGEVLASGDRSRAAEVAPPQGLVLEQVVYP